MAFFVRRIRGHRRGTAVNGGAARSVGDHHAVAEKLSRQFDIRCFAAACTSTGEFKERLFELRTDNGLLILRIGFRGHFVLREVPQIHLTAFVLIVRDHGKRLGRADIGTAAAFKTVELVNDDGETVFFAGFPLGRNLEARRRFGTFLFGRQNGTDGRMRADKGALCAADTLFMIPGRNIQCGAGLFKLGGTRRHGAVFAAREVGNFEVVANLAENGSRHLFEIFRRRTAFRLFVHSIGPGSGIAYFVEFADTGINSGPVHVNDFLSFFAVRLDDGIFQIFNGVFQGDNLCESKERSLHHHVDTGAEAEFLTDSVAVQGIEFNVMFGDSAFNTGRQFMLQFVIRPGTVQHERAAVFNTAEQIEALYIGLTVTSDIIRRVDKIRHINRLCAETQVRNRYAAGFFGVIRKVSLRIHVRMVADNLDGRFIGADRTVGTEAPEFTGRKTCRIHRHFVGTRQGKICNVVDDADGKAVQRMFFFKFRKYGENIFRKNVLRAETCATADNIYIKTYRLSKVYNIEVQGFAHSTRFFCTVDNGNFLNCLRQYSL